MLKFNLVGFGRVCFFNLIVFVGLLAGLEISAGVGRVFLGKNFLFGSFLSNDVNIDLSHPCVEMKTDVLLSHSPNDRGLCSVKNGAAWNDYVVYDFASKELPQLLVLGGSTSSGLYQHISNGETFPMFLAESLADDYYLVNGGVGGYSSLQEYFKLSRDAARFTDLRMVIALNGINDMPGYNGVESVRSRVAPFMTELQADMNGSQSWIDQRQLHLLPNLLDSAVPNLYSLFSHVSKTRRAGYAAASIEDSLFSLVPSGDRWEVNVSRSREISRIAGADYLVFLQPTLGLLGPQSAPVAGTDDYEQFARMDFEYLTSIREHYRDLKMRCARLSFCIDISDEVPPSGGVYNDPRHHNATGNKILADVIHKHIMANLEFSDAEDSQ